MIGASAVMSAFFLATWPLILLVIDITEVIGASS